MAMDKELLNQLRSQAAEHCASAVMALNMFNTSMDRLDRIEARRNRGKTPSATEVAGNENQVWTSLHLLVNAAAIVAKHLWPSDARRKPVKQAFPDRGEELRKSLGVVDTSPLKGLSGVRNGFEHADERLEEWWLKNKGDGMVTHLFGPTVRDVIRALETDPTTVEISGGEGIDPTKVTVREAFDTTHRWLYFLGDEIEIEPVIRQLIEIYEAADDGTNPFIKAANEKEGRAGGNAVATEPTPSKRTKRPPAKRKARRS